MAAVSVPLQYNLQKGTDNRQSVIKLAAFEYKGQFVSGGRRHFFSVA